MAWDVNGDGRTSVRAAGGIFYGSITGNEWNTTADNQPFTVRQSIPDRVHAVRSVPQSAGRRRPVPVRVRPGEPALHAAGHGLRPVARLRLAEDLSDERHGREDSCSATSASSASYVGALGRNLPASIDRNYPVFGPGATAANVNSRRPVPARHARRGARARIDLHTATTTRCS